MSDLGVKITDQGPKLDTSALRSAGKALLSDSGGSNESVTPASPAPAAAPAEPKVSPLVVPSNVTVASADGEQPVTSEASDENTGAASPAQGAEPKYVDLPDDALVRMTINGQEQVLPWGEARKQMMLHRTFTQNQQKLAQERKQVEELRQQMAQMEEFATRAAALMSDPQRFAEFAIRNPEYAQAIASRMGTTVAQATAGASPAAQAAVAQSAAAVGLSPSATPSEGSDELVSFAELQQVLGGQIGALQQHFGASMQAQVQAALSQVNRIVDAKLQQLRDAHEISQFNTAITNQIASNLEANPALKAIPAIEELIRYEVSKMRPETPEEMLSAIDTVAKGIVEGLDQTYNQSRQAKLIQKEKLVKEGLEPPAGGPPNTIVKPAVPNYVYGGKMDWKRLREMGKAALS